MERDGVVGMGWLTATAASRYLGVSRRHLSRLIAAGLPHGRLGENGDYRFVQAELDRYLRSHGVAESEKGRGNEIEAFIAAHVDRKVA